jgi:hypothetical protein
MAHASRLGICQPVTAFENLAALFVLPTYVSSIADVGQ